MSSEGSGTGHGCVHRHCDGCAQPLVCLCHRPFFTESSQGRLGTGQGTATMVAVPPPLSTRELVSWAWSPPPWWLCHRPWGGCASAASLLKKNLYHVGPVSSAASLSPKTSCTRASLPKSPLHSPPSLRAAPCIRPRHHKPRRRPPYLSSMLAKSRPCSSAPAPRRTRS